MAEFPSLPLFTDAYIADTQHLTNEEHGVYLRLLMFAWRSPNCALPADDRRLSIMVGVTPKKWARLKPSIMAFWTETELGWQQDRLTFERRRVAQMIKQKSDAGIASARAKSRKTKEQGSTGVVTGTPTAAQQPDPDPYIGGGGGSAREEISDPPKQNPPDKNDREKILEAIGADPISGRIEETGKRIGNIADLIEARGWRDDLGLTLDEVVTVITSVMATKRDGPPNAFAYFTKAMQRAAGQKTKPALTPIEGQTDENGNRQGTTRASFNANSPSGRSHQNLIAAFAGSIPDEP